jgi:arginyl-tRNA synthetase
MIESANAVGPYINLKLSKNFFTQMFFEIFMQSQKPEYFYIPSDSKTIVIDYIGAHVGYSASI